MQTIIGLLIALGLLGGAYYFFTQAPSMEAPAEERVMMDEAGRPASGTYNVVTEESIVLWAGGKPLVPGYTHRGTIRLAEGMIEVGEDTASGSFIIDMNTLEVTSLGGGKDGQESGLERHLKDGDFFGVTEFPTATFTITSVTPTETADTYTVSGTLTMKGVENQIAFPATITGNDERLTARAEFEIDRTEWGITFGSSDFVSGLAENAIGNSITLSLTLIADRMNETEQQPN